jgi:RNA polymerase sigma-B factor
MPTRRVSRPHLSPDSSRTDVNALIARWHANGDETAREALFNRFLPLARKLARRYRTAHEPFEDLVQVASLGLLGAIDRFDSSRGTSFASFAIPTILGELKKHFRSTGWAVHVPRGQQEIALKIDQAVREIVAASGRDPGVGELAEYLELSAEEVVGGLDAGGAHYAMSLDAPLTTAESDDPDSLIDTVGRDDDGYALVETAASLTSAIARLPYGERQALSLRLGRDIKQSEIAAELGCSQMQVSRLLRRAAVRLREMTATPSS